ncbi:hypothetical protein SAMN02910298_01104 [Pseudobutyrivibrio sp. YE44]|uniref:hypothetical protein n=1 Tax=Pseudobutyrivibrio sp. YE44 TaxID=1520802 RepID=UPI0008838B2A|nr:hypothetical protein [Pseudobutyrivibrio sp. YE44]SDB22765.1 hypothetical protein SAMN02910298_01104 [Pseudobutyrivibrio sp. YE44]
MKKVYVKRIILAEILAASIFITGCSPRQSTSVDDKKEQKETEAVSTEESSAEENIADESEDNSYDKDYWDAMEKYYAYIGPKQRDSVELDDESASLYDGFLNNTVTATFHSNGDISQYVEFSEFLKDGHSYSLNDIVSKITEEGQYGEGWTYESSTDTYIDCGLDGNIEMIVSLLFDDEFTPSLVIKNIDGKLNICFTGTSWSRCETSVYYTGEVCSFGSGGATYHGGEYGYIDALGKYNFWYSEWDEGYGDRDNDNQLHYFYDVDHTINGADLLDILRINFVSSSDEKNDYYYIHLTDSDYNEIEDDPTNPDNPYDIVRDILINEQGYNVISPEEAEKMITEKRRAIGLTDEIYSYGDELKPEEK